MSNDRLVTLLDRRPDLVVARFHDDLPADEHRFYRCSTDDERPGIEPFITVTRCKVRMLLVEQRDVRAQSDRESTDRPLQGLCSSGKRGTVEPPTCQLALLPRQD